MVIIAKQLTRIGCLRESVLSKRIRVVENQLYFHEKNTNMNEKLKVPLKPQQDSDSCVSLEGESIKKRHTVLSSQENLVTKLLNDNIMKNQDYASGESKKTLPKDEDLPAQPFVSNNNTNSDVKATEAIKELDLNAEESSNKVLKEGNIINKFAPNQLTKLTRKQLKKQRNKLKITNKEAKNLAVIIKRSDGVKVDKELAAVIQKRFLDHVLREGKKIKEKEDCNKFQFLKSGIVDAGYFLVTAENEKARDWLMSIDLGTYEGAVIRKYRRGKGKKKAQKRSKDAKSNNKDLVKDESTNALIIKEQCSGEGLNNQDLETEELYNPLVKDKELLPKQCSSVTSLNSNDFVKDKPKSSSSVEGIISKDFGAEESVCTDIEKED